MYKYESIRYFVDSNIGQSKEKYEIDYNLLCRISQMYHELEKLKSCYERVLEKNFKKEYMSWVGHAKQCLYNTRSGNPRKQDLIDGINWAIEDLEKATTIEKSDK